MNIYYMEDKWYTYNEIIQMFGICKQTLYNWRKNKIIEYKKITRKTYLYLLPKNKNKENENQREL